MMYCQHLEKWFPKQRCKIYFIKKTQFKKQFLEYRDNGYFMHSQRYRRELDMPSEKMSVKSID